MNIPSILRHWFTFAAAAITAWLVATLTLSADDHAALAEAFGKLIEPVIIIVSLLAVAVWRIFLAKAGTMFRRGAGEETDSDAGASGGKLPLALFLMATAAGLMGVLPSCTTGGDGEYPVTASLSWRDPNTGAKAGLTYTPKAKLKGAVTVPVYDADTGERIGTTTIRVDPASGK